MTKFLKGLSVVLSLILIILVAVLILLIKASFKQENEPVPDTYQKGSYKEYNLTKEYLRPLGRYSYIDGRLYFSHSGSGIEFICKGDYAEVTLCSERTGGVSSNHRTRFAIFADGNMIVDECIDYEERTFRIDTSYSGTKITIIKLSEALFSSFAISKVSSFGIEDIVPTEEKELKIEFIGDSITCGYGIDEGRFGTFSTETENFSKSYAYITALNLDAQYSAVCFSGYGVVSGYTNNGLKNNDLLMPEYEKACLLSDSDPLWEFNAAVNDLVVVNLGTNDASYAAESYSRRQEFVAAYVDLLAKVRQLNPSAYILCILGDMNNAMYSSIESAVALYSQQTGDSRTEAFMTDFQMDKNDIVIDGHPGEKSNRCASEVLTEKIRSLINAGFII